jgi:hypothetical protein
MSPSASIDDQAGYDWARDADPLFTFLGFYLGTFQSIEGRLDQIILLGAGFENWEATQDRLARMDNRSKVEAAALAALDTNVFPLVAGIADWTSRVEDLVKRLHEERRRRNGIMHSQYLMEGLEHGLAAIRSSRTRGAAEASFDQEELSRPRMNEILQEIATLACSASLTHAQLIQAVSREKGDRGE